MLDKMEVRSEIFIFIYKKIKYIFIWIVSYQLE